MLHAELDIEHKHLPTALVATARYTLKSRADLPRILDEVRHYIPDDAIAGPAFCILRFVTSVQGGYDAEVGFPVTEPVAAGPVSSRVRLAMDVLALVHPGPLSKVSDAYRTLYEYTSEHAIISDEFAHEVYLDGDNVAEGRTEVHFVVHNWNKRLAQNLDRVVGAEARQQVMRGGGSLSIDATQDERFRWVKSALARLEALADDHARYDVLSSCAHVFPEEQIAKLRQVYVEAQAQNGDPMQAVDAVLAFMAQDPGWGAAPTREGTVLYATKQPRDSEAHARAQTAEEKRRAYCFCPLIREHLNAGMPPTFCYCGAGWYRQQWEGALGQPVTIAIVKSILKGDDVCTFAIQLPDTL
jgi:effector-binding domain-containing protein